MRPEDRALARRKLDNKLKSLTYLDAPARPPRGWLKAIREALGMTTAQLAGRLGVSQSRVVGIEKGEKEGSISLKNLERAAQALDCRFAYVLIPRKSLEDLVSDRALRLAEKQLESTRHSMSLEAQGLNKSDEKVQLELLAKRLTEKSVSRLWKVDL